jgi:diguanylate cyclase (GGDEF)-like protein
MLDDILLVDDDVGAIEITARILSGVASTRFATCGADALRLARESVPDLILLDAEMPGMTGFQVCEALKADAALAEVPVIFVTSHCDVGFEVAGLDMGAADFIAKPIRAPIVLARVKNHLRAARAARRLREATSVDDLTGVANRRRFDEVLLSECLRARRAGDPLALLSIDIDHFRQFNERYGRSRADACLQAVAVALAGTIVRPADLVARYGTEGFMLLLPLTARRGASCMAHRILDAIESLDIAHDTSPTARHVTVSAGLAVFDDASAGWSTVVPALRPANSPPHCLTAAGMLLAVERAQLSAKHAGRAQAHLLDLSDLDTATPAREIDPSTRNMVTERPVYA